jgi:hypothetical protein
MKTKNLIKLIVILIAVVGINIAGCKKENEFKDETGQDAVDNNNVQSESDNAVNDADNAVSNSHSMNARVIHLPGTLADYTSGTVCGASLDTSLCSQGIITMNFDGVTVCNNRKRSGSIKATLQSYTSGKRWLDAGAVLQLDFNNYLITRASDGKSIKFNGTKYITNVSGGNLVSLYFGTQPNLVRTVVANNLQVTFDGTNTATWNINRQFTYTFTTYSGQGIFTCTVQGLGSNSGINNLENWGTTRNGDPFTSEVVNPVIWNTTCGAWAPVTGEVDIKITSKAFDLILLIGVDASGNAVTPAPNTCPYGMKISWTYKSKTGSKIYPYF